MRSKKLKPRPYAHRPIGAGLGDLPDRCDSQLYRYYCAQESLDSNGSFAGVREKLEELDLFKFSGGIENQNAKKQVSKCML